MVNSIRIAPCRKGRLALNPAWIKKHSNKILVLSIVLISFFLIIKPFSHTPEPPISGTLETIQKHIPSNNPTEESTESPPKNPTISKEYQSFMVDVKGQVKNPGVYTLPVESRVMDAIHRACGLLPEADEKAINLAAKLVDEMVIYIPANGEIADTTILATTPASSGPQSSLVNINIADEVTLMTLSGIGPSKAKAILAYREEKGLFQSIDEIKKVTGIGDQTFESLKDFISIK